MLLVYFAYMVAIMSDSYYTYIGFTGLVILNLVVFFPRYVLKLENGQIQYSLDNFISKKVIKSFNLNSIEKITIKQLENKYFSAVLVLKNGDEIFLDSTPTKDKIQDRINQIENQLKTISP